MGTVGIGYLVAIGAQMAIFPAMGIRVELKDNLIIGLFLPQCRLPEATQSAGFLTSCTIGRSE